MSGYFGASGDLTHRKLVPALFELFKQRRLPSEFAVLGCARRPWTDEIFKEKMEEALASKIKVSPKEWELFSQNLFLIIINSYMILCFFNPFHQNNLINYKIGRF